MLSISFFQIYYVSLLSLLRRDTSHFKSLKNIDLHLLGTSTNGLFDSLWPTHAFTVIDLSAARVSVAALAADADRAIAHSSGVLQGSTFLCTRGKMFGAVS